MSALDGEIGDAGYRRGTHLIALTMVAQVLMVALGAGLLWFLRRDLLLAGLRPGLSGAFIVGMGATTGVVTALLALGAYWFIPAYARSLAEVTGIFRSFSRPALLAMAIPSAFGEELLFRGSLQVLSGPLFAAAVFGLAHTGGRRRLWSYGLSAAVIGYLFGLAYQFTGELWVPVLAHAAHNGIVTLALTMRAGEPAVRQ